jgi:hypothetical protein
VTREQDVSARGERRRRLCADAAVIVHTNLHRSVACARGMRGTAGLGAYAQWCGGCDRGAEGGEEGKAKSEDIACAVASPSYSRSTVVFC